MADWSIRIPMRGREDSLSDVGFLAGRALGQQDAAILREILVSAVAAGFRTSGELVDRLERLGPEQRRGLLDSARRLARLPTASEIDANEAFEYASHGAVVAARQRRFVIGESGGFIDLVESEAQAARDATAARSRAAQREARRAEAQVDAQHLPGPPRLPRPANLP